MNQKSLLRKTLPMAFALAVGLSSSACSSSTDRDGKSQAQEPLHAGQLLTAEPVADGLPDASQNFRISYASTSADGDEVVVFGRVALPKTPAPPGGYPVVSWGNGTTGVAPQCAPSLVANATYDTYLNEWLLGTAPALVDT